MNIKIKKMDLHIVACRNTDFTSNIHSGFLLYNSSLLSDESKALMITENFSNKNKATRICHLWIIQLIQNLAYT